MGDSAIICDQVTDADADVAAELNSKANRTMKLILMKRKQPVKHKIYMFRLHFY